jgi:hypothetical protein
MTRWTHSFLAAATILAGISLSSPRAAEARGRFALHGGIVVRGFYRWPHYGYAAPYCGFSPYWGPCYGPFGPYGMSGPYVASGFNPAVAASAGVGVATLDVKPGDADVWVDRRFVADARDLDGDSGFLWLREGPHDIVVYKGSEG